MELKNLGSLITYDDNGQETCLGYLFDFTGHGIYSPDGKVEITKEQAEAHNKALDEAMVKGLDDNCKVGQGQTFYYVPDGKAIGAYNVTTFAGTVLADTAHVERNGNNVTFYRGKMTFRGRVQRDADCINFRRVR